MRTLVVTGLLAFAIAAGFDALPAQNVPAKLVLPAKMGNVTFDHTAHVKRANNDCAGCHNPGGAAFQSKGTCGKCHVKT